jgi:hypothetical protein
LPAFAEPAGSRLHSFFRETIQRRISETDDANPIGFCRQRASLSQEDIAIQSGMTPQYPTSKAFMNDALRYGWRPARPNSTCRGRLDGLIDRRGIAEQRQLFRFSTQSEQAPASAIAAPPTAKMA